MFWEFGIVSSEIEDILDKDSETTLVDLLNEPDFLQEINSKNTRLIEYCSREEIIETIFVHTISNPDDSIDELSRYKYPMICSEMLTVGVASFDQVILDDETYFTRLFEAFNQDKINILMCNFMVKLFVYFATEYAEKMYDFIVARNIEIVDIFLKHIAYSSICDAILKLQSHELTTEMRAIFIELLYEQNIIGKLYCLITYESSNEVKSSACNLFVEIIRIHRVRPTLFLDNFKYTENMVLVEQAQSDNLLKLLLGNIFAYTATDIENVANVANVANITNITNIENIANITEEEWTNIDKTINYGCIMILSLFDTTRISDSLGDEFNEFGYIRNTILTVVASDLVLLSAYLIKFVNYLQYTITKKIENLNADNHPLIFGTTNINIVRLLAILTIFQCETIEQALINSKFFKILWKQLPRFNRNNAFHGLLFETTTFILLSDIYKNAPNLLAQNNLPKETVLANLKTKYDFAHPLQLIPVSSNNLTSSIVLKQNQNNSDIFIFGKSTLLYDHLINDIQVLLILLNLHETYCYTVKCDFRGHLMQLASRLSKLPCTSIVPNNPDLTILSSLVVSSISSNITSDTSSSSNTESLKASVKQQWEFFCNTNVAKYRKDNEIDPNVFTTNSFHEDHLDSLFRSFDSNFVQSNVDHNGSYPFNSAGSNGDSDTLAFQANVRLEVEQGIAYMESIKNSLLFGSADNLKFPNQNVNGAKNAFVCSSDDEHLDEDCFGNDDKLPSFDMVGVRAPLVTTNNFSDLFEPQGDFVPCMFDDVEMVDVEEEEEGPSNLEGWEQTKESISKLNAKNRMENPDVNTFEFGEKNNKYIESVMVDSVSKRLQCKPGTDVYASDITPNLSSNSIVTDFSSSSLSTLIDVDRISADDNTEKLTSLDNSSNKISPNKDAKCQLNTPSKSLSCGSDVFYSLTSVSEIEEFNNSDSNSSDRRTAAAAAAKDSSISTEQLMGSLSEATYQNPVFQPNSSSIDSEHLDETDRKGTSSPLKLSLSYNSEENDAFDGSSNNGSSITNNSINENEEDDDDIHDIDEVNN